MHFSPLRRISELVPAAPTQHPTFKIMRRSELDRRRQKPSMSRPGSVAGEEGDLSDPGPSETGSMGSRSTTSKKRMTIEERQAAYDEARNRIFMNFEEKEKTKERDTSASSSTLSLVSGSGSGSQSGGVGCNSDNDDGISTIPTESESSIPNGLRRGDDSRLSSTDSLRSLRSNSSTFTGQGSGNGQGVTSPAVSYPSIYGATPPSQSYSHPAYMPPPGGYATPPYPMYAYPAPVAGPVPPGQPYLPSMQFFPHYPYMPPQQPAHSNSDPTTPANGSVEDYPHQPTTFMSSSPYHWGPPMPPMQFSQADGRLANAQGPHTPIVQGPHAPYPHQYTPYMPPSGTIPYPNYQSYFPPPPPPSANSQSQPTRRNENQPGNGQVSESDTSSISSSQSPSLSRHTSGSSSNGHSSVHLVNGGNKRGAPPTRGSWSYGPGIGMQPSLSGSGRQPNTGHIINGDSVGPRLNSARRASVASSVSSGHRTPGDETASTAVSYSPNLKFGFWIY